MTYRRAAQIGAAIGAALIVAVIGLRLADRTILCRAGYDTLCDLSMYTEIGLFPGLYLIDIGVFYGTGAAIMSLALATISNIALFAIVGCLVLFLSRRFRPEAGSR